jgi:hypothetical protein
MTKTDSNSGTPSAWDELGGTTFWSQLLALRIWSNAVGHGAPLSDSRWLRAAAKGRDQPVKLPA